MPDTPRPSDPWLMWFGFSRWRALQWGDRPLVFVLGVVAGAMIGAGAMFYCLKATGWEYVPHGEVGK